MIRKLKPCPFCGGKNIREYQRHSVHVDAVEYHCKCMNCGVEIFSTIDNASAIELWNTRQCETPTAEIDWEQRKYDTVKDLVTRKVSLFGDSIATIREAVRSSVVIATVLIEELKGGKK